MTRTSLKKIGIGLFTLLLALVGLALAVGGAMLVYYGGSFYYLLAGLALVACASAVIKYRSKAFSIFLVLLACTMAWSLWEVGFSPWELLPRLALFLVAGVCFVLLPGTDAAAMPHRGARALALCTSIGAACIGGFGLHLAAPAVPADPLLRAGVATAYPAAGQAGRPAGRQDGNPAAQSAWPAFGNDLGGTRFSPLTQISADNVGKLEKAWEADTGPASPGQHNDLEVVPIMIGDTLYACNGHNRITAFDAETGVERWHTDISNGVRASGKPCRGVSYYKVSSNGGVCAERIFAASQSPALVALDAHTGKPCEDFGAAGFVDLNRNISRHPFGHYYFSSAPQIIRGKVVVGGSIPDGQYWGGPSGVIRAFDAKTGELAWAYDSNQPDRIGAPPDGAVYSPSSPNNWAPMSADETLGLVYVPMGGATPDNYGGQRRPGDDQIGSSVLALDAETGRKRWHFQTTHHDIWDYDVPSQPTLADIPLDGKMRHILIQPTKRGEVFVLDRETGRPIYPVQELAVPQGGIAPGERLSPTQPFSLKLPAFQMPRIREQDMWGITPLDQLYCRIQFRKSNYVGHFTPLTLGKPVIIAPGSAGGVNWGSVSLDLDHNVMVVNWMRLPDRVTLVTREEAVRRKFKLGDGESSGGFPGRPMLNTPYGAYGSQFLSPLGVPCSAPPWGLISAVDLNNGKLLWSKPLGTGRDTGPLGIPTMLPLTIGVPMTGGSVTTRSGLVFIAATAERTLRALDVRTGREIWSARLPAGGNASPVTYISPRSGRQFVVIAAGGRKSLKVRQGTKIVAYALPHATQKQPLTETAQR
ncbi:quinoprotein glucose dehydrogenase [Pseudoduganella lurida]|uniref:Quinoprotein glucose dehydrogenase n=1 Tax=Pseudoduganella lurida TaxID=1036180 RepID=A0A562R0D1_9BURK|nr:pyrroloquinoline quinone-dependent dehydrogenase [Pseudoduganella lurida]TWI62525.1 quinoprotein glucose dehydrogenase [Pseudoduganella lurida]